MPHTLYLVPSGTGVGLTSLALGLVRALDNRGIRVAFFKPIGQPVGHDTGPERSTYFIRRLSPLTPATPISLEEARRMILAHRTDELLERVMRDFHASAGNADVVVVEGLVEMRDGPSASDLNLQLVQTLSAQVIMAGSLGRTPLPEFESRLELSANAYGGFGGGRVIGCLVNRVPVPLVKDGPPRGGLVPGPTRAPLLSKPELNVIGAVPENPELTAYRTIDIAKHLEAETIHEGEMATRRVKKVSLLARTVPNLLTTLSPGSVLITPGDRTDVVLAVAMAAANKIPIAGLVLTGGIDLPAGLLELCRPALETGLPILRVGWATLETATRLGEMSTEVPVDDLERVQRTMDFVAQHIDADWLARHAQVPVETRMSPAAFCFRLTEQARAANKRIVLPEGNEPRTMRAATICAERRIARCVLLGAPTRVRRVAAAQELELPDDARDPRSRLDARANYVTGVWSRCASTRDHRARSRRDARGQRLARHVMLALGEVDGLVSGAVHSTANTIRPALQIIKTKPGASVVSSIFFMCLPEQVRRLRRLRGDPRSRRRDARRHRDPERRLSAAQIRHHAARGDDQLLHGRIGLGVGRRQSARSDALARAKRRPICWSTVRCNTTRPRSPRWRPAKAPNSPVAGRATVFVFPDLNTGNTTYKAVQRSAHVVSIGPMLQGMRRPVNDLSRGALVDDIVYTIALTAIQADETIGTGESPAA